MDKLKDNFTNKYFNTDNFKTQLDLINQPTEVDAYADAFSKQANREAKGPAQRNSNALMAGLGAGLKGAANAKRQEKISPILKMVGELNARSAYLEAQMQQDEMNKLKIRELFKQNSFNLMNFSKANLAKDTEAANESSSAFVRSYKQIFGDKSVGAQSHTHDGTIFYENNDTGRIDSANIAQMIAQSGIKPEEIWGDDADMVMAGLSAGAREKFKNTQELQRQQLEKGRADIDNTKAQTGLYSAKAGKAAQEVNNPPMTEQDKLNYTANKEHMDGLQKFIKDKSIGTKIEVLNRLEKIFKQEESVGGTPVSAIQRWAKKQFGTDEKLQEAEILKKYFFPDIKGVAGNPNREEWTDLVTKIISTNQNPTAALDMIEFERNKAQEYLDEYEDTSSVLSTNPYQLHHHPDIRSQISLKGEERRKKQGAGNNQPKDKKVVEKLIQWD